jgi:Flp pilus assembly protein TadG
MRHYLRDQRGQSLTEFALALPVLAVVLFALAEFGLMLNNQITVVNASRDGARVAVLQEGDPNQATNVQTAVNAAEQPLISCANAAGSPSITSSAGGGTVKSWTVTVTCNYTPVTPLSAILGLVGGSTPSSSCSGGGLTICESTTMRGFNCNPPSCTP